MALRFFASSIALFLSSAKVRVREHSRNFVTSFACQLREQSRSLVVGFFPEFANTRVFLKTMPRQKKIRRTETLRLASLSKKARVSQSGTAILLDDVKREGLPSSFSRGSQYRARKETCAETTPYGKLVVPFEFEGLKIGVQNPFAFLYKCTSESPAFADHMLPLLISGAICKNIFYADGITPSDALIKHDKRSVWAVYWSLLDFGITVLGVEEVWMTLTVVRSKKLAEIAGGLSRLLRRLLEEFFFKSDGNNFESTGMFLKLCGQERSYPKPLLANYYCTIADEPALKEMFMAKGHAGKKPCLLCMNVILARFFVERMKRNFIPHTAIGGFKHHTDASIRLVKDKLSTAGSPGTLEELEIIHGFNYHPDSLSCSPHVGVASSLMWDWFHCYLEDGLIDNEFGELMCALKASASPFNYEACRIYVSHWSWPKAVHSPDVDELLGKRAAKNYLKSAHFSSSGSDLLSLAPVLALFLLLNVLPSGCCTRQVESMLAAFDVLELLLSIKALEVTGDVLHSFIVRHLQLRKEAYGPDCFRPKHHYVQHLGAMLAFFGFLISCFVHERHHKVAKLFARWRNNTKSYEVGLLEDMTVHQLHVIKGADWNRMGFLETSAPSGRDADILAELYPGQFPMVSRRFRNHHGTITVGDVASYREGCVGEVFLLFALENNCFACVPEWINASSPHPQYGRYRVCHEPKIVCATSLVCSLIHTNKHDDDIAWVLLPPKLR